MDAKMTDNVNSPDHYARFRFTCEPKDLTKHLPHPLASAIEYILRAPFKGNELEDLKKAVWWLTEFENTSSFWVRNYCGSEAEDSPYFCNLIRDTVNFDYFEIVAIAYAICGQSRQFLRKYLLSNPLMPVQFPRSVYKDQIGALRLALNDYIRLLESED